MVSRSSGGSPTAERWEPSPLGGATGGARTREAPAVSVGSAGAYLRLLRPHHWWRNLACLAGWLFSGRIGTPGAVMRAVWTFLVFCAASSAVYALNDVFDRTRDREHARMRWRPVASGSVSVPAVLAIALGLAAISVAGASALGLA